MYICELGRRIILADLGSYLRLAGEGCCLTLRYCLALRYDLQGDRSVRRRT